VRASIRALLVLAALLGPVGAHAQASGDLRVGVVPIVLAERADSGAMVASDSVATPASGALRKALDRVPPQAAPLASLLIPGLGQARLRQGRAVAYLAAEAFLLVQYTKDLSEAHRNEREYRDIARSIARRGFAAAPPDTVFQYYEKLGKYIESGAYSLTTSGPVMPETDTSTYNGAQWDLARRQFGVTLEPSEVGSPAYQRALEMYERLAVQQSYRWSWRNAQLEKDIYVRTIARANDAYRRATLEISAVIANHLLSAVDAFTVVRLSQLPGGSMRLSASIPVR